MWFFWEHLHKIANKSCAWLVSIQGQQPACALSGLGTTYLNQSGSLTSGFSVPISVPQSNIRLREMAPCCLSTYTPDSDHWPQILCVWPVSFLSSSLTLQPPCNSQLHSTNVGRLISHLGYPYCDFFGTQMAAQGRGILQELQRALQAVVFWQ